MTLPTCAPLTHILETSLYVDSLPDAERFYSEVLGLKLHSRLATRHVFFKLENQMLLLFDARDTTKESPPFPDHGSQGTGHIAFRVAPADLPAWEERIRASSVPIEKIIDWPHGGRSIYFRDPSGNLIELANPEIWRL